MKHLFTTLKTLTFTTFALTAFAAGAAGAAGAAEPGHVIIDPSDGYATTLVSIPASASAAELDGFRKSLATRKAAKLVTWAEFKGKAKQDINASIRRNDYPEVDLVTGVTQLLEQHHKTPFGVTWNGGIALTGNDYMTAQRSFAAYKTDPQSPAAAKRADRSRDPLHPLNHFAALLKK